MGPLLAAPSALSPLPQSPSSSACSSPTCLKKRISYCVKRFFLVIHSSIVTKSFGLSCFQRCSIHRFSPRNQTNDGPRIPPSCRRCTAALLLCRLNPQKYYDDFQFRKARTFGVSRGHNSAAFQGGGQKVQILGQPSLPLDTTKKSCLTLPFPPYLPALPPPS